MSTALELYRRANHYLNEGLIRPSPPAQRPPRSRRQWMEWFLPLIGEPQRAFPAIHVAGTSGKGSVALFIAEILRAAGVHVGLHVSPYLQLSTEKLWVDGLYASADELAALVDWLRPLAEVCRGPLVPLHGLAAVAITLEHFRRRRVEVAVVEVGVGGRHDVTNVLRTSVAVVSSIGYDHLKALGSTLEDIAWHKVGVIQPRSRAVVLDGPAARAARVQAAQVDARLRVVGEASYRARVDEQRRVLLDFGGERLRLDGAPLGMPGAFQAANAALALAAVEEWDREGRVTVEAAREGLLRARLPARLEVMPARGEPCAVVLDGAHNPDKLDALLAALPQLPHRRLHVVYGALAGRELDGPLRRLAAQADSFVATEPRVYGKPPRPAAEIGDAVSGAARARVRLEGQPAAALAVALQSAGGGDLVLVTGSIYLCGELRGRWFPEEQVLEQRRSFFAPDPGRARFA
jgi:dihydrofolate synthase / folylpolyglutamate synthase